METNILQYQSHPITLSLSYEIESPQKRQEREFTTARKRIFLQILEDSRGIISATCQKAEIARATFYVWMKTDPKFKYSVQEIQTAKPDLLEDRMYLLALKGEFRALKYLMDRVHPGFKVQPNKNKETVVHIHHHATPLNEKEGDGEIQIGADELFSLVEPGILEQENNDPYFQKFIKKYRPIIEFLKDYYDTKPKENIPSGIENVKPQQEQKTETPVGPSTSATSEPKPILFTRDMRHGCTPGDDIKLAQEILNMDPETQLMVHGESGSLGHEQNRFGNAMQEAVERFQIKYFLFSLMDDEYGIIEIKTREKLQEVYYKNNPRSVKMGKSV